MLLILAVSILDLELDGQICKTRSSFTYWTENKCRACGETKNLIDGFYRTRKDRGPVKVFIFIFL